MHFVIVSLRRDYRRRRLLVYNVRGLFVGNVEYDSICLRGILSLVWNVCIRPDKEGVYIRACWTAKEWVSVMDIRTLKMKEGILRRSCEVESC